MRFLLPVDRVMSFHFQKRSLLVKCETDFIFLDISQAKRCVFKHKLKLQHESSRRIKFGTNNGQVVLVCLQNKYRIKSDLLTVAGSAFPAEGPSQLALSYSCHSEFKQLSVRQILNDFRCYVLHFELFQDATFYGRHGMQTRAACVISRTNCSRDSIGCQNC